MRFGGCCAINFEALKLVGQNELSRIEGGSECLGNIKKAKKFLVDDRTFVVCLSRVLTSKAV